MELIGSYQNGNYKVSIYDDGTKVRENDLDFFEPERPESMDIKITNACDMGCPFCHEDSKPDGKHGDILNLPFLDSIHPYTELAIGGGNPLSHPKFREFLELLKERKLIANVTVNQHHFLNGGATLLSELSEQGLVYGVGVSVSPHQTNTTLSELITAMKSIPNTVLHMINGVHTPHDYIGLAGHGLRLLILGYKEFRRGETLYEKDKSMIDRRKNWLFDALPYMVMDEWFDAVSFDNLAIGQLDVRRLLTEEEWSEFYMGDDGRDGEFTSASMYIDAVNMEFAKNSCSTERFPVTDDLTEMYRFLKSL